MLNLRTNEDIKQIPVLETNEVYIYILMNEIGKIKVGITKDIFTRLQSLSGSNGQGINITKCYCSNATYLKCIEKLIHSKLSDYRIKGTEWFFDKNDTTGIKLFNDAIDYLNQLMNSKEYVTANMIRAKGEYLNG